MPIRPPTIRSIKSSTPVIGGEKRESACKRGYGRRWQAASKGFLARHPLCAECESEGRVAPATLVDHVVPHRGDMGLFWQPSNWQGLCVRHHQQKTNRGE